MSEVRSLCSEQLAKIELINQYAQEEHSTPDVMDEEQVCIDDFNEVDENFIDDSADIENNPMTADRFMTLKKLLFLSQMLMTFLILILKLIIIFLIIISLHSMILIKKLIIFTALKKESKILKTSFKFDVKKMIRLPFLMLFAIRPDFLYEKMLELKEGLVLDLRTSTLKSITWK